jgi:hypothetical protein
MTSTRFTWLTISSRCCSWRAAHARIVRRAGKALSISAEGRHMATKYDLADWVVDALRALGGSASLIAVCRQIWEQHEAELRRSGDLFFTWQYDTRWAAYRLRVQRRLRPASESPRGSGSSCRCSPSGRDKREKSRLMLSEAAWLPRPFAAAPPLDAQEGRSLRLSIYENSSIFAKRDVSTLSLRG